MPNSHQRPLHSRAGLLVALVLGVGGTLSCGPSAIPAPNGGGDATTDRPANGGSPGAPGDAAADGAREQISGIGASCSVGGDCASGHCFDGVCCQEDCSQACHSCALPNSVGTCLLAEVGSDPREDCQDEGSASCGRDGTCDGSGACRKYPTGIVCKAPSCSGSTVTLAFRCGGGVCSPTSGQPCDPYVCGSATSCANTCTRDADCTPPNKCENGSCGKRPQGGACSVGDECNSGICQQNVCCGTSCTGACRSCALPGSEGTCTNVPERQDPLNQCNDSGPASCGTDGACDGLGACHFYPRGISCRPAAGICDVAETCDGTGAPCPADGFATGTVCRASAGVCDVAEVCSGSGASCPPDAFAAATVCRQPAGICDTAESCTGTSAACPPDGFVAVGTACRSSAGICDVVESCTGTAAACPPDLLAGAGTPCRGAVDLCDVVESCTGMAAACPPDAMALAGTPCRGSAGLCDVAESCTGASVSCPRDDFAMAGTPCRGSAGMCDVAESCTGGAPDCPGDGFVTAGTPCRGAMGGCDLAESCSGGAAACPPDAVAPTPTAPTGLIAQPLDAQVILSWTAVAGATGYSVKRSATAGGPYTTIATPATPTFTNTGLTNGTTLFYVISATSVGGGCESPNSAQVAAIPSACPGVYCDDFEADTVGGMPNGWTRIGGSAGDWATVAMGSKFFEQNVALSLTLRAGIATGASGAPWSGAITATADIELLALGTNSAPAAMICPRFVDLSNYYCLALMPTGVQIQTKVNGNATNSAIFPQAINTGSINMVRLSLGAGGVLSATLNNSVRGTLTPTALASGFAAVVTTSAEAAFDNIVVSQP